MKAEPNNANANTNTSNNKFIQVGNRVINTDYITHIDFAREGNCVIHLATQQSIAYNPKNEVDKLIISYLQKHFTENSLQLGKEDIEKAQAEWEQNESHKAVNLLTTDTETGKEKEKENEGTDSQKPKKK